MEDIRGLSRKDQAYQAGQWSREAGRPESSAPQYGPTEECAELRKQWRAGWKAEDDKRRKNGK